MCIGPITIIYTIGNNNYKYEFLTNKDNLWGRLIFNLKINNILIYL